MNVSQKVLDAIELLATSSVNKAEYDKTIQAQILSCEDATIGKYRCRYQDSVFYAYSNNSDMTFTNGSYVYILVPGNDMSKQKTILGSTKKLGINYISQLEKDQIYNINGTNCVISNEVYYLNSDNKYYLYDIYNYENNINNVTLDIEALEHYIKQSSSLLVGATFRTQIPPSRQYRGHYGIAFNLRFQDNASNQQVIRSYIIDEDNMIDNPYKLIHDTRQYQVFDIDGSNFIRVESIEIFNKDFPNAASNITTGVLNDGDIIISNLEISGVERMAENEINGVAISFYTPQGTFFTGSSTSANYKTITAQVKVKGKLVSTSQKIPFYWGRENVGITPSSQYYNKYIGRGWQCLNNSNIIEEATATTDPIIEWVPGNDTYILNFNQATARHNKFKVAIIYDGNVITKEIDIQNLVASMPVLTIESNDGTNFYYDIGHPNLTCKVNEGEPTDYKYYWAYESNAGIFSDLPETTNLNIDYENAVAALASLRAEIASGTKYANAETENLNNLAAAVKAYNFIQRVQGNKIYNVQIKNITNFGIFKCSVYNAQDIYLGTASIILTNSLEGENFYSLVINNGSEAFQYNENGVAPNNKSVDNPIFIQNLSFTIYDSQGKALDNDIIDNINNCKIRWAFPIKNTMLVEQAENGIAAEQDENYKYYDNIINLSYNIAPRFNTKNQNNQIKLTVDYKGISLTAETDFTFVKQGEPGTNGTRYYVKIIPNTQMSNPPLWPMITKSGSDYIVNYGIGSTANETTIGVDENSYYKFFKAQLWHSGELVWEGTDATNIALDNLTYPSNIRWEILQNKYNYTTYDDSAFQVIHTNAGDIRYTGDHLASALNTPLANIVKCSITYEGKIYYGTIPIITAWTISADYKVNLKDYTGYRHVIYSSDGISPQYNNSHPFEFIINEKINNIWEDVSNILGTHTINYTPSACGNIKEASNGSNLISVDSNLLTLLTGNVYRQGLQNNQWYYKPASTYNGECVNQAVTCIYSQNGTIVGKIHIPIHFLLNKYGLSNLNNWDGNSIQINEEGGYILSPQMGAGVKNNDNSFTGVLMGEVKTPDKSTPDIGLMGYSSGSRTFFLNSQNGAALFGKKGSGQIALDPSAEKALLYSDNFWENYNVETGLPNNYNSSNEAGQGLLIDLTTPEIRFGNGNFKVDDNGVYIRGNFVLENGTSVQQAIEDIQGAADDAIISDTLHYLVTSYNSGVTTEDGDWGNWSTNVQNVNSINRYLWTYHTYIKGDGSTTNTNPVITGVYGDQGSSGEDTVQVIIESSVGNMFLRTFTQATLTCYVRKGLEDITDQVTRFSWIKKNRDGIVDVDWSRPSQQSIEIDSDDIKTKAIFVCEVEF